MLTSGKRFLTRDRARGTRVAEADGNAISRTRPLRSPAIAATSSSAASRAASTGVGVPREHLAGLGEPHVAPDPLDEHGAGALLEAPHHLRDGGLGVAERDGGSGELPSSAMAFMTRSPAASIMGGSYNAWLSTRHGSRHCP